MHRFPFNADSFKSEQLPFDSREKRGQAGLQNITHLALRGAVNCLPRDADPIGKPRNWYSIGSIGPPIAQFNLAKPAGNLLLRENFYHHGIGEEWHTCIVTLGNALVKTY